MKISSKICYTHDKTRNRQFITDNRVYLVKNAFDTQHVHKAFKLLLVDQFETSSILIIVLSQLTDCYYPGFLHAGDINP